MYKTIKRLNINKEAYKLKSISGLRNYRLCSPPRSPGPCDCKPQVPSYQTIKPPPSTCRKGEIPPNPCVPRYHHGKGTWKKYKYIALFFGFPLILIQVMRVMGHKPPAKESCREYEYMRRRTKRFPWRDGNTSLFHNEHVNNLPEDCKPPPLDCD